MNKARRRELRMWMEKAEKWAAQGAEIKSELENICSEEEDYFDNMPENLQGSQNGMNSEESIEIMNETIECMDNAIEAAEEAVVCIEDIL